jgi:hypothetical protein
MAATLMVLMETILMAIRVNIIFFITQQFKWLFLWNKNRARKLLALLIIPICI